MTAGHQASSLSDKRRETNCGTTTSADVGSTGSANRARRLDWTEPVVLDDDPRGLGQRESPNARKSFIINTLMSVFRRSSPRLFPLSSGNRRDQRSRLRTAPHQLRSLPPPFSPSNSRAVVVGNARRPTVRGSHGHVKGSMRRRATASGGVRRARCGRRGARQHAQAASTMIVLLRGRFVPLRRNKSRSGSRKRGLFYSLGMPGTRLASE